MRTSKFIQESIVDAFKGVAKEVWLISVVQLINKSGMMVLPFLALYLTKDLDWTLGMAATAGTSFGLGNLAGSMVGGYLADRYPVFKIMMWSLLAGGICFTLLTWITSFELFVAWIFITTTVADMLRPAAMGAVSEFSDETNLTRGISVLRMAINLGIAIGPFVGGLLIEFLGYEFIFIADGLTCFLAGLLVLYFFRNNFSLVLNREKEEVTEIKSNPPYMDFKFLLFLFFNMLMLTMFFQILHTVPLFFKDVYLLKESEIGIFFMMNGLLIFFTEMPIIFGFEKRNQAYKPMVWGAILIGLSFIFLIVDLNFIWLSIFLFNFVISIGEIINFPFISTLSIIRANKDNKGSYIGYMSTMFSLAFVLSPLVFMPYIEILGYQNIWIICCGVSLFSALALHFLRPSFEKGIKNNS